jgi:hypothetical protein
MVAMLNALPIYLSQLTSTLAKVLRSRAGRLDSAEIIRTNSTQGAIEPPTPEFYRDLPFPPKSCLLPEKTMYVGPDEGWVGRIVISVGLNPDETCRFYQEELPLNGWRLRCQPTKLLTPLGDKTPDPLDARQAGGGRA